ncbi:hypothetical protein ACKWTF_016831 [Chironomus riparius]
MEDISGEDILQIFATEQDLSFSDNSKARTDSSDNVLLKIFTKGSMTSLNAEDIAEFLIHQQKLNICGLSFKSNSVLFEISHSSQLNDWIVKLFEERHSNMKLTAERRSNILKVAKGKFNLVINNNLIFLVIIPGTSAIMFPCLKNSQPYGLCNETTVNVVSGSLPDEPSQIILKFLNARNTTNHASIKPIYGIRLEWNDEKDSHILRFLIDQSNLSDSSLNALKNLYGSLSFSSDTLHIIPTLLKTGIDKKLASGLDYSDVWKFIMKNDLLLSEVNEMPVVAKIPTINSHTRNSLSRPSSSTIRNTTSLAAANSSRSIFDRLMPRDLSLG